MSHAMSRSGQPVTQREGGCRCPALATGFIEDVGEVIGDGFFGEAQGLCDLAIALALDDELEHLSLALGQMRWKRWACWTSRLRGKSMKPTKDLVCGMGHPQFLKQGKRLTQQLLCTPGTSLTASCEFKIGSCEKCARQFWPQSFALSRCLGCR